MPDNICNTAFIPKQFNTCVSPHQTMHMLGGKHFEIAGLVVEKYTGMMKNASMLLNQFP